LTQICISNTAVASCPQSQNKHVNWTQARLKVRIMQMSGRFAKNHCLIWSW